MSDLRPILFNNLYIVFALAFFLSVLSGSQPKARRPVVHFTSLFTFKILLAALSCRFAVVLIGRQQITGRVAEILAVTFL